MKERIKILVLFGIAFLVGCASRTDPRKVEEAGIRYRVAQELLAKGETTQALAELLRAEKLNPKDPEVQNALGLAFVQSDKMDLAEQHLAKAASLDPNYSEAQNNLCTLLIERERYDEAIARCLKAVENVTYGTPERAYQNMGFAYQKKGDMTRAMDSYRKALLHNQNFVMTRRSLGEIFLDQKKFDDAAKQFEAAAKVCEKSPEGSWGSECPASYYQLAMTYIKLKQRQKAVVALKSCVSSDVSEGEYGKKCQSNLKLLE